MGTDCGCTPADRVAACAAVRVGARAGRERPTQRRSTARSRSIDALNHSGSGLSRAAIFFTSVGRIGGGEGVNVCPPPGVAPVPRRDSRPRSCELPISDPQSLVHRDCDGVRQHCDCSSRSGEVHRVALAATRRRRLPPDGEDSEPGGPSIYGPPFRSLGAAVTAFVRSIRPHAEQRAMDLISSYASRCRVSTRIILR